MPEMAFNPPVVNIDFLDDDLREVIETLAASHNSGQAITNALLVQLIRDVQRLPHLGDTLRE
jgi:hypothetical protein